LIWSDGEILNQWVEVKVLVTASTGLAADDLFYFGNVAGDADGDRVVGDGDYDMLTAQFGLRGSGLAADFNGDERVDLDDLSILQNCYGNALAEPPILVGDADRSGVVDGGDYVILIGQFGLSGKGLVADFDGNGRVGLEDFAILRGSFGDTLPAAPEAPAAAPVVPVVSQRLDDRDASDDIIAVTASAADIDLIMPPSSAGYLSGPEAISAGSPAVTLQLAATAEYDLRPLMDDLPTGGADDLLVDLLAESLLAVAL
jgi:hypothetical protein